LQPQSSIVEHPEEGMISVLALASVALLCAAYAGAVLTMAKPAQEKPATIALAHYFANT
jgi:hypothetical protein